MIEHPQFTRRALLVWQSPLGSNVRRDRHAVAELVQLEDRMEFRYLDDAQLEEARLAGFTIYPGLPINSTELDRIAEEVLIRRLPPRDREDFDQLLGRFGLPPNERYPALTLLAYTGARLTSDSFSICETFDGFEPPFTYIFDVAGSRHYQELYNQLPSGEPLILEREPSNLHDPDAIRIARADGTCVGYVNRLQTGAVGQWLDDGRISASVFRANGRRDYPRLFVLAEIGRGTVSLAA